MNLFGYLSSGKKTGSIVFFVTILTLLLTNIPQNLNDTLNNIFFISFISFALSIVDFIQFPVKWYITYKYNSIFKSEDILNLQYGNYYID